MCSRTCSQRTEYTLMHEMCTDVQNVHWCMKCVHWCMKCALLAVNKKWSDSVQSALLVHICTSCVFCAHFMHQCTLCTYVSGGYRSVCTHHIIHKIKNSGWRNVLTHLFTTRSDSVRIFRINVHSGRLRCVQKCVCVCTHHRIHRIKKCGCRNVWTNLFTTRSDCVHTLWINVYSVFLGG